MTNTEHASLNPLEGAAAIASFYAREGLETTPEHLIKQFGAPSILQHPDLGQLLNFRGGQVNLWVSVRGNVVYYSGDTLYGAEEPVSAQECFDIAQSFAERHIEEFKVRNYTLDDMEADKGSATIRWTEYPRPETDTAIFPNWIEVVVQIPSGRVSRYSASDLRLVRTDMPGVSEAQAREIIKGQFTPASIEEIELMQLPTDDGMSSFTVWTAQVMTLAPEGPITIRVTINADTGEIVPE